MRVRADRRDVKRGDGCLPYFAKEQKIVTIDITGGAPEMNPHLEYLIEESSKICGHVIVRTNLVILLEKEYEHLMEVYAKKQVECMFASVLPCTGDG